MKRLNPKTQKILEKDEVRDDGYIFVRYAESKPIKGNGYFIEEWSNPSRLVKGMQRINPETRKPFKSGDQDFQKPDLIFKSYSRSTQGKNGFCYENWCAPEVYLRGKAQATIISKQHKIFNKKMTQLGVLQKRQNSKTGENFKEGDRNSEGKIFFTYVGQEKTKGGYTGEYWGTEPQFLKRKISGSRSFAKIRAEKKNVKFDITAEYLLGIFPQDYICPALNVVMSWGGDMKTSPSLDRILPDFGYIEGNVAWISGQANTRKLTRTPDALRKMADWMDIQLSKKGC